MQHPTTQDMHFSIARRQLLLRFAHTRAISDSANRSCRASKRTNRAANIYSTFYNRWAAACYCCTVPQLLDHSFGVNEEEPAVVEANEKQKKNRKEKKKYLFHSIFNMKRKRFISIEFSHTTERAMSKAEWKRMNGMREEIVSFPDIFILGQRQLKQKRVIKRPIVCSSQLWASATSLRQTWRELNAGRKKLKNYQKNIVNQTTERF